MFSVNFQELDVDFRAKNKPEILPQCAISNTVLVLVEQTDGVPYAKIRK